MKEMPEVDLLRQTIMAIERGLARQRPVPFKIGHITFRKHRGEWRFMRNSEPVTDAGIEAMLELGAVDRDFNTKMERARVELCRRCMEAQKRLGGGHP